MLSGFIINGNIKNSGRENLCRFHYTYFIVPILFPVLALSAQSAAVEAEVQLAVPAAPAVVAAEPDYMRHPVTVQMAAAVYYTEYLAAVGTESAEALCYTVHSAAADTKPAAVLHYNMSAEYIHCYLARNTDYCNSVQYYTVLHT